MNGRPMLDLTPAPRTSAEVRIDLRAAQQAVDENKAAYAARLPAPHPDAERRLARLREEFEETDEGQAELAGRLNALENADADTWTIAAALNRMLAAAGRRNAKIAAATSMSLGNDRAATYQLRYGAHAGWLGSTSIAEETRSTGGVNVYPDYAVGRSFRDTHVEQDGYEERAQAVMVLDQTVVYEAPVVAGPKPDTWIAGTPGHARLNAAHRSYDTDGHPTSDAPHQLRPVLFNAAEQTVSWLDPHTNLPLGPAVDATTVEALRILDYNDGLDLSTTLNGASSWPGGVVIKVVEAEDGTHLLHAEFNFSLFS